ncbi:MAG: hypothetical protein J6P07_08080 [Spirochaetaceae bacterium]|nr:hypothetical protein [Spirochaetaceae bacterium]
MTGYEKAYEEMLNKKKIFTAKLDKIRGKDLSLEIFYRNAIYGCERKLENMTIEQAEARV